MLREAGPTERKLGDTPVSPPHQPARAFMLYLLADDMAQRLRISSVEYLNTAPLVWGFTEGPLQGKYDISFTVPSQCAEALRNGDADVAIIPAVEYQRIDNLVALPGMSIAAAGEVRSILLVAKKPVELAKRIALDSSSRSSAALVRILAKEKWHIDPEFVEAAPEPSEMLQSADAALVIGDPALRISLKMEALAGKSPRGETCCQGDASEMPVPGFETLFVYDVAYQWRELTGKPCVLAIWSGRPEWMTPEVVGDFQSSLRYGMERIGEIAEAASIQLDMPPKALERYLTENIHYGLEADFLAGLELYYQKCAGVGAIPRAKPLQFAAARATPSEGARAGR